MSLTYDSDIITTSVNNFHSEQDRMKVNKEK